MYEHASPIISDFSKIEAGMLPIESYEFDFLDTVESVLEVLYTNARSKNLDLVCFVHPECPRSIIGDPARLRQVLMNLVSNAIKVLLILALYYTGLSII
jgi:signal transduction histidine kinase